MYAAINFSIILFIYGASILIATTLAFLGVILLEGVAFIGGTLGFGFGFLSSLNLGFGLYGTGLTIDVCSHKLMQAGAKNVASLVVTKKKS